MRTKEGKEGYYRSILRVTAWEQSYSGIHSGRSWRVVYLTCGHWYVEYKGAGKQQTRILCRDCKEKYFSVGKQVLDPLAGLTRDYERRPRNW